MSEHNHSHSGHAAEDFHAFYAEGQKWSGNPNTTLVREAEKLTPGTALDIGCGEGADVAWLAKAGWDVIGTDPIQGALDRAREVTDAPLFALDLAGTAEKFADTSFDLVSAMYIPLEATQEIVDTLASLVAPGGTLLFVHHQFDEPNAILSPQQVAEMLGDEFPAPQLSTVDRGETHGAGAHHRTDLVLVATRA
ncbi:class I SAM-dependent methyltransferase [Corynebacterium lubricantis]|uniref:class I SAM-dependent methyltransferase n=1 Tax=Corynebacterium lubricantis TaxID=541095 RepID=UPI0003628168|nr:class I SAM-dependent methyltransferase [Corynebacterium lubricantis]